MQNKSEINILNLREYLLGSLAPNEIEEIDLEIISNESLENDLNLAESELMEDYLDKILSPTELKLFRENFLVTAERKVQLKQITMMRDYARSTASENALQNDCSQGDERESFVEKLKKLLTVNLRPAFAVLAVIIAGIFIATLVFQKTNELIAAEIEFAAVNKTDLSNLSQFKDDYTVNLMSGTFRNTAAASNKLYSEKLTEKILFRLALPVSSEPTDTFKVELIRDQKIAFTQINQHYYNNSSGQEVRLFLPSSVLQQGEYQIKVSKETAKNLNFTYTFTVE